MNSDAINLLGAQLCFVGGKKGSRRCGRVDLKVPQRLRILSRPRRRRHTGLHIL